MANTKEIVGAAIEFENYGHSYYMRFHELVADKNAKALMKSLANDEKEHADILSRELTVLGGRPTPPSNETVLKGLAEIFPESIRTDSIATSDAISAVKLGMRTEERSIEFYSKNAKDAEPKLREIFTKLEKMERGHLAMLKENLRYLEDDGSWFGYVPILEG